MTVKIPVDIASVPTAENFLPYLLLDSFITNMQLEFQRASNEYSLPKSGQQLASENEHTENSEGNNS